MDDTAPVTADEAMALAASLRAAPPQRTTSARRWRIMAAAAAALVVVAGTIAVVVQDDASDEIVARPPDPTDVSGPEEDAVACTMANATGIAPSERLTTPLPDAGDARIWGRGSLFTVVVGASYPVEHEDADGFRSVKLPWFRTVPGDITVTATRLFAPGEFESDVPTGYPSTGLQPSGLRFGGDGCWRVVGSHEDGSELVFNIWIP
jgi:hypothetical protein